MSVSKMRKVVLTAVIAAVAVFIASVVVLGANVSGYERLKAAGFRLIENVESDIGPYSNGCFKLTGAVFVDDREILRSEQTTVRDGDRELKRNVAKVGAQSDDGFTVPDGGRSRVVVEYSDSEVLYSWYDDGTFYQRENIRYRNYNSQYNTKDGEYDTVPPAQRQFIEAVADALVGDTRNYFVTDKDTVRISLSGNQIPIIAQYAVAALLENLGVDSTVNIGIDGVAIGKDARISSGSLEVKLDGDDNVMGADLSIEIISTVDGRLSALRIEVGYTSQDVGATTVQRPKAGAGGRPVFPGEGTGDASMLSFISGTETV